MKRITVHVSDDLPKKLIELAKQDNRSMANLGGKFLEERVNEEFEIREHDEQEPA